MIRVVNPGRPEPRRRHNPGGKDNPDARERVLAARVYLISPAALVTMGPGGESLKHVRPYLATAVMALVPTETHHPELTTMAVDSSWRLYYNAEFVLNASIEALAAVIEHEIWHLLRRHPERFADAGIPNRLHKVWNIAADCEIHNDERLYDRIRSIGIEPYNAEKIGADTGGSTEEYFNHIMEKRGDSEDGGGGGGGGGGGEDDDEDGGGSSEGDDESEDGDGGGRGGEEEDEDEDEGEGRGKGESGTPQGSEDGSAASGVQAPWELPPTDQYVDRSTEDAIIRDTGRRIIDEDSMGRGTEPSGAEMIWAKSELEAKVDWREELASAITEAYVYVSGSSEFSRRRMSRRQASSEFVLAGLQHPVPEIAVVIDASGSMDRAFKSGDGEAGRKYNLLAQAIGETANIIEQYGQVGDGVQIFATTTTVEWAGRVYDVSDIKMPEFGGGTDLTAGMQAAYWSQPTPNIIIVLTDGETPWPDEEPPGVEVVIGIIGTSEANGSHLVPHWANRVVWIND